MPEPFTPPPLSSHQGPAGFVPPPLTAHQEPADSGVIRPATGWEKIKQNFRDLGNAAQSPLTLLHEINRPVQPPGTTDIDQSVPYWMLAGANRIAPEGVHISNAIKGMLSGQKFFPAIREAWQSARPPIEPFPGDLTDTTLDTAFHGQIPPVAPYQAPPNVSWTAGTRGAPAQTTGEGAVLNPLGESFVPAGQPLPKPRDIAPVTKVPGPAERFPSDVGRPTVKDEFGNPTMYADNAEAGTIPKIPPVGPKANIPAGIPERYHAHFERMGGEIGTREAIAKDQAIAKYLMSKKVTPEQWESAPTAQKVAWMKEANPKYRFQSGSRSRQEADFTSHVADTMREIPVNPETIPGIAPVTGQSPAALPDLTIPKGIPHFNKFSQTGGPYRVMSRGGAELGSYDTLADAQKAINDSSFINGMLKVKTVSAKPLPPKTIEIE